MTETISQQFDTDDTAFDKTESLTLTISDVITSSDVWTSEGGISNPYDRYVFNFDDMKFIWNFESSTSSNGQMYDMEIIDEYTIRISGLRAGYNTPARITIINPEKLQLKFIDDEKNNGNYYLVKTNESFRGFNNTSNTNEDDVLNDSLTVDEERLFEYLKKSIDSFKNPASVRIIEVYAYDKDDDVFYVDISAENSLGGNTLELYEVCDNKIYKSMTSRATFERIPIAFGDPCSCDIATINNLLKEYFEEMDWI